MYNNYVEDNTPDIEELRKALVRELSQDEASNIANDLVVLNAEEQLKIILETDLPEDYTVNQLLSDLDLALALAKARLDVLVLQTKKSLKDRVNLN